MSGNFPIPVLPVGSGLPAAPHSDRWGQLMVQAVDALYYRISRYLNEALGAVGAQLLVTSKVLYTNYTLPVNSSAVVGGGLTLGPDASLTLSSGSELTLI